MNLYNPYMLFALYVRRSAKISILNKEEIIEIFSMISSLFKIENYLKRRKNLPLTPGYE